MDWVGKSSLMLSVGFYKGNPPAWKSRFQEEWARFSGSDCSVYLQKNAIKVKEMGKNQCISAQCAYMFVIVL